MSNETKGPAPSMAEEALRREPENMVHQVIAYRSYCALVERLAAFLGDDKAQAQSCLTIQAIAYFAQNTRTDGAAAPREALHAIVDAVFNEIEARRRQSVRLADA